MWVTTTDHGLINLDFVVSIQVRENVLKFYRAGTPDAGSAARPERDLIGTIQCSTPEEADQRLKEIEAQLNAGSADTKRDVT